MLSGMSEGSMLVLNSEPHWGEEGGGREIILNTDTEIIVSIQALQLHWARVGPHEFRIH